MMRLLLALAILCGLSSPAWAHDPALPDPVLTPGAVAEITADELCAKSFRTRDVRSVRPAAIAAAFVEYLITCRPAFGKSRSLPRCGKWEIDHLVSLELGGQNSLQNLWPQKMTGPWNARLKDKLENRLHKEVCLGNITLQQAQEEIAKDWRVPYRRYFGEPKRN